MMICQKFLKKIIFSFLFINTFTLFCQEKSIKESISELNSINLVIKDNFKLSGNIIDSKLDCKNYFFKNNNDTLCFIGLKKIDNFLFFLPIGNYNFIKNEFKLLKEHSGTSYGSVAPSNLLIYNIKLNEFYYIKCLASGNSKYSKESIEYNLYFDIYSPILLLDNKLNPKYYFFDTEEDGNINLAYYEILFCEKYFQINSYAQKERKNINVLELKFDELKGICKNETVLIKKEYFRYNKLNIFNIYNQKTDKELMPALVPGSL